MLNAGRTFGGHQLKPLFHVEQKARGKLMYWTDTLKIGVNVWALTRKQYCEGDSESKSPETLDPLPPPQVINPIAPHQLTHYTVSYNS